MLNQDDVFENLKKQYQKLLAEINEQKNQTVISRMQALSDMQSLLLGIAREIEWLEIQQDILAQFLEDNGRHDFNYWDGQYYQMLANSVRNLLQDYENLVNARESIFRNNIEISLSTKSERKEELDIYLALLTKELNCLRFSISDNAQEQLDSVIENIKLLHDEYQDLLDSKTKIAEEYYLEMDKFDERKRLIKEQLAALDEYQYKASDLMKACTQGDIAAFKKELPRKSSIILDYLSKNAANALHVACRFGHVELVEYLLNLKIDVNALDDNGYSPLHYAVMISDEHTFIDIWRLLLEGGVNLTITGNRGRTVLHTATLYGNSVAVALLIEKAPSLINQAEKGRFTGNTPIHNAAFIGDVTICRMLLEAGASLTIRNRSDNTPAMEVLTQALGVFDKKLSLRIENRFRLLRLFREYHYAFSPEDIALLKTKPNYNESIAPLLKVWLRAQANLLTDNEDVMAIPLPLIEVFDKEKFNSAEKKTLVEKHLPKGIMLGDAKGLGDCFFDAFSKGLLDAGKAYLSVKTLRMICHDKVKKLEKGPLSENWIYTYFLNQAKLKYSDKPELIELMARKSYEEYRDNILYTADDIEAGKSKTLLSAIWGEQELDGRILRDELGVDLHVIEVQEAEGQSIIAHQLNGASFENYDNYEDNNTVHVVVFDSHFSPIIRTEAFRQNSVPYHNTLVENTAPLSTNQQGFFNQPKVSQVYEEILTSSDEVFSYRPFDGEYSTYREINISPNFAYKLLSENSEKVSEIVKPGYLEALQSEAFLEYLHQEEGIEISRENLFENDNSFLNNLFNNATLLQAYLRYVISDGKNEKVLHPSLIQALGELTSSEIRLWVMGENNRLIPHPEYGCYKPSNLHQSINLLLKDDGKIILLKLEGKSLSLEENTKPRLQ